MKKALTLLLAALICTSTFSSVYALAEQNEITINAKLQEISTIVEKINRDIKRYDISIILPAENQNNIYDYYKNYSNEEIETELRTQITSFLTEEQSAKSSNLNLNEDCQSNIMSTTPEEIYQDMPLEYNSTLRMYATVYGTGTPIVYRYRTINSVISYWPKDYTGFHFSVTTYESTISSHQKSCSIVVHGYPKNAAGVTLTVYKTITAEFHAN